MGFKKLLVLSILAFLGFAVIFSVSMSGNSAIDTAQAYKSENEKNGIESSSDMNTNVRSANPLESLTELAGQMNGHTEVTIYNQNLALVKEKKEFDLEAVLKFKSIL